MDLLLYLVRRHEVELGEIMIHKITDQYLQHLEVLEQIDINQAGDFIEVASLLVEMKLKTVLPKPNDESNIDEQDPREDLVQRLLLYKEFKDVSILLGEQSQQWQDRFPRVANDLPPRQVNPKEQPIQEIELWDLVSSFGRVLRNNTPKIETNIVLDETPIHVYMNQIYKRLGKEGALRFSEMFEPGMHKSALVGIFLAILELVRHHDVETQQIGESGDIQLLPGENFSSDTTIEEPTA